MAQNNIVPFTIKVQRELHSDAEFNIEHVYDGVYKAHIVLNPIGDPLERDLNKHKDFSCFGIGTSERDAKETAVEKSV